MTDDRPRPGGTFTLAGREVARVGYGAGGLTRLHDDRAAATVLLRRAVELGVNHIDTAQFYGDGRVNDLLRGALQPADGVIVATKVGADPDPGGPFPMRLAQRPEQLRASVEDNLRSLDTDHIALVNLRRPEGTSRIRAEGDQVVDLDDQLEVLTALRDAGTIGGIGLSSVEPATVQRALPAGVACVQNEYSLVGRGDDDLLDLCAANGVAWVPFYPLGGMLPGARRVVDEPAVRAAAETTGVSSARIGLAWLLQRSPNVLLIPGTASVTHLEDNIDAASVRLAAATLSGLDAG